MLDNVMSEFEAIGTLKEANSNMFVELQDHLDDLQVGEIAFTDTVLQAARANPQNAPLQKKCIETLLCMPDVCRKRNSNLNDCIAFLLETMGAHVKHGPLQESCCKALSHLQEAAEEIGQQGGIQKLLMVISAHVDDAAVEKAALSALLDLTIHNESNRLIAASSGAVQIVQAVMPKAPKLSCRSRSASLVRHIAEADVQSIGDNLLGILVSQSSGKLKMSYGEHNKLHIAYQNAVT